MADNVKPTRSYRSRLRREQALETRERVLHAAHESFVANGYERATVAAIAAGAGVSAETVYATFGNKRTLLTEVMQRAARGDASTPILEQEGPRAVAATADPREKIRLFTIDLSVRLARAAPMLAVVAAAAAGEPELGKLRRRMHTARRQNLRTFALQLDEIGRLGPDVDAATDTIWALASPELYSLLVGPGGWTPERHRAWLQASLEALLLAP